MPATDVPAGFSERLVAFCRDLRARGLNVTPGRALDAGRSVALLDPADRVAFHTALRANLTVSVDEHPEFEAAFARFWGEGAAAGQPEVGGSLPPHRPGPPVYGEAPVALEGFDPSGDARLPGGDHSASDEDLLTLKDFATYDAADVARARALIRQLTPVLATVPSRRFEPAGSGGQIDMRRTVQSSQRRGGEVVELARRRRKLRRLRVVALCDVSGSMDRYGEWLLQFLYALQQASGGVRTFVFSTRLHDVTHVLRRKRFDDVLAGLARTVDTWSGGTTIGQCLGEFNTRHGARLLTPRTVVIIASDGWERGDTARLKREMAAIHRRAHRVVWLNPLKGHAGYEPLAAGMSSALPFVDHFLAANSLDSLRRLARVLAGI